LEGTRASGPESEKVTYLTGSIVTRGVSEPEAGPPSFIDHQFTLLGFLRDGFSYMLDNDCEEDMAGMYSLLWRIPDGIAPHSTKLELRVRKAGLSAVIKAASDAHRPERLIKRVFNDCPRCIGPSGPINSLEPRSLIHDHEAGMPATVPLPCINKQSIGLDGNDLVWLPSDFKPVCAAFHEDLLVCGLESGRILFLDFSKQSHEPVPEIDYW
jgi:hypothetical protein